jgi:hypothetical protein
VARLTTRCAYLFESGFHIAGGPVLYVQLETEETGYCNSDSGNHANQEFCHSVSSLFRWCDGQMACCRPRVEDRNGRVTVTSENFADFARALIAGAPADVTSQQLRQLHIQPNLQDN